MKISRRDFLENIGIRLAGLAVGPSLASLCIDSALANTPQSPSSGWNLWGGKYQFPSHRPKTFEYPSELFERKSIFSVDFQTGKIAEFAVATPIHSVLQHPVEPRWLACASKRSDIISIFDKKKSKEISFAKTPPNVSFNGHTAFADHGRVLIAPCTDLNRPKGYATGYFQIYRVPDLKPITRISMDRMRAHDLIEVKPNFYVMGLFGGAQDSVNFGTLDFQNGVFKSYAKTAMHTSQKPMNFSVTHVEADRSSSKVFGLSNNSEADRLTNGMVCGFNYESHEIELGFAAGNHNVNLELLSVAYDKETGYLWTSIPEQNAVLVWDFERKSLVNVIESWRSPLSVTLVPKIDAVVIGCPNGLKAHHRKSFRNLTHLDKNWSSLNLKGQHAPHTQIL